MEKRARGESAITAAVAAAAGYSNRAISAQPARHLPGRRHPQVADAGARMRAQQAAMYADYAEDDDWHDGEDQPPPPIPRAAPPSCVCACVWCSLRLEGQRAKYKGKPEPMTAADCDPPTRTPNTSIPAWPCNLRTPTHPNA